MVRLLISRFQERDNIQDITRKKLFEDERVIEFFHPTTDDEMFQIIREKRTEVADDGVMMICIDNFPSKCNTLALLFSPLLIHFDCSRNWSRGDCEKNPGACCRIEKV